MTLDFLRFSHYYCFFPPSLHEHRAEVVFAVVDGREVGFALYFNNFSTFIGHSGLYIVPIHLFIIVLLGYFHFLAIHKQSMAVGFNM